MASKDHLPMITHGMHPHSGTYDLMQQECTAWEIPPEWRGHPKLVGIPSRPLNFEHWKHGATSPCVVQCASRPCTMLPLLLDQVNPKSTSLTHNVLVKIQLAPLIIAMYGPHTKHIFNAYDACICALGHDFSGNMACCGHERHSPVRLSRRDGAESRHLDVQACRKFDRDTLICVV